jgi:hypothetical protein
MDVENDTIAINQEAARPLTRSSLHRMSVNSFTRKHPNRRLRFYNTVRRRQPNLYGPTREAANGRENLMESLHNFRADRWPTMLSPRTGRPNAIMIDPPRISPEDPRRYGASAKSPPYINKTRPNYAIRRPPRGIGPVSEIVKAAIARGDSPHNIMLMANRAARAQARAQSKNMLPPEMNEAQYRARTMNRNNPDSLSVNSYEMPQEPVSVPAPATAPVPASEAPGLMGRLSSALFTGLQGIGLPVSPPRSGGRRTRHRARRVLPKHKS